MPSALQRLAVVAAAPLLLAGCTNASAQAPHAPAHSSTSEVRGPAPARAGTVVVANKQDHTVSLVDAATGEVVATLPVGTGPHEAAASRDGRWAVIANYGDQTTVGSSLSVIDLAARSVVRTISLGEYRRPHGIAFLPGDRQVAVTAEANQVVLVIDLESERVEAAVPTTQPASHMLALVPDGRTVYTANIVAGTITEIDLAARATGRVLTIAPMSEAIAVLPDGREVWVGSNSQGMVSVVDVASWSIVATLSTPGLPYRIAFTPDGRRAVIVSPVAGLIRIFDVASRREVAAIPALVDGVNAAGPQGQGSGGPVGIAVSADGAFAYVALQQTNEVAVVDLSAAALVGRYAVGRGPDGVAIAPPAPRATAQR